MGRLLGGIGAYKAPYVSQGLHCRCSLAVPALADTLAGTTARTTAQRGSTPLASAWRHMFATHALLTAKQCS